jgi:hypothetical protein
LELSGGAVVWHGGFVGVAALGMGRASSGWIWKEEEEEEKEEEEGRVSDSHNQFSGWPPQVSPRVKSMTVFA